jgi:predicted amidophosphoribosyltransferase
MLLECNDVELVIVNLEDIEQQYDEGLKNLVSLVRCVFIIKSGARCDSLKASLDNCAFVEPDFMFDILPEVLLKNELLKNGKNPFESVYVTGNGKELKHAHELGLSTIYFSNPNKPIERTAMPDHIVSSIDELIKSLEGKFYGYFGELYAHGVSGIGRLAPFEINHLLYPEIKSDLIVTGRYFTSSDPRAYIHPLSQLLLQMKNGWRNPIISMGKLLSKTIRILQNNSFNINHITIVPPKHGKVNILLKVLEQATIGNEPVDSSLINPDLLTLTRNYSPQKESGGWTERYLNVKDAFTTSKSVSGHVLLFDDIITSGATAMECSRVLYEAGADRVSILAFGSSQSKIVRESSNPIKCEENGCNNFYKLKFSKDNRVFFGCTNYSSCKSRGKTFESIRREYNQQNKVLPTRESEIPDLPF